jgi:integrase
VLPIRPALAKAPQGQNAKKTPASLVVNLPQYQDVLRAFQADCEAAKIPQWDASKRVVDFHALRHTFITSLAKSGVHPKTAQMLARHSTITLTMDPATPIL